MKQTVGKNLKQIREANKYTQAQVAEFLDIERGTLSNYELGTREAPFEVLQKLADLYGVDFSAFFETDRKRQEECLACAFRIADLSVEDMKAVSVFKDVVKSYLKMCTIETKE